MHLQLSDVEGACPINSQLVSTWCMQLTVPSVAQLEWIMTLIGPWLKQTMHESQQLATGAACCAAAATTVTPMLNNLAPAGRFHGKQLLSNDRLRQNCLLPRLVSIFFLFSFSGDSHRTPLSW
jgi:hypothetical protein